MGCPRGHSTVGHIFVAAFEEVGGGMVTSTSHSVSFIARMLSVVHAIHPADSSLGGALSPSLLPACSKAGISWTPMVNNGRNR